MAQARRIKPKPAKKKNVNKNRRLINLPWGLMFVILASGVVLGMLFNGANYGEQQFGAGLKQLFKTVEQTVKTEATTPKTNNNNNKEKEFEFYEVLPDIEKVMPKDLTDINAARPIDNSDYFLQAASFLKSEDADKFRAQLALKGFKSVIQTQAIAGKGTYYRIRLGPFANKRVAKTEKNKLQKIGIEPFVFSVKK